MSTSRRFDLRFDGVSGITEGLKVIDGYRSQGDKGGHLLVVPESFAQLFDLLVVGRGLDALFSLPAARMYTDVFFPKIEADAGRIGLDVYTLANSPRWCAVSIGVKTNGEVLVYQG